jgi:serine/threonine-protein kinase RsbW
MQMRLFIPREHARVDDLNASLEAVLANNGVSRAIQGDVRLIVEELASNAIDHGDASHVDIEEHELCVDIAIRDHLLTLEFRESGAPFNPLEQPAPDLEADILDRPTGGLGLHLVRQVAEVAAYQRMGNYNVLRLSLRIPTEETPA